MKENQNSFGWIATEKEGLRKRVCGKEKRERASER